MADLLHLVDKPEGWTSHDAVARLRAVLGESRVGHAGTLDPFASGLLLVGEGRATGLLGCLGLLPKRYLARARLGVATDTQDRTGVVTQQSDRVPTIAEVEAALERFRGRFASARHFTPRSRSEGRGSTRPPAGASTWSVRTGRCRSITSPSWTRRSLRITLDLTVQPRTYVRTIAHDLGAVLGSGAHLAALRRVESGPFRIDAALSCDRRYGHGAETLRARALPLDRALSFLPRVRLDPDEAAKLRHGRAPVLNRDRIEEQRNGWSLPPGESGWPLALTDPQGDVLALARPWEMQSAGLPAQLQRVLVGA